MKNNISKITILSCLFLGSIANAQNFYTCVPKEDYIKNLARQTQRSDEDVRNLARQVRRTDSEIKTLIKSNSVNIECKIYHLKNDRNFLEHMSGFNIVTVIRIGVPVLCSNISYREIDLGLTTDIASYCGDQVIYPFLQNVAVEVCKIK